MCEKNGKRKVVKDFTNTIEALIWRVITNDWRQGLKNPSVERNPFELVSQQAKVCYQWCKEKGVLVDLATCTTYCCGHSAALNLSSDPV